MRRKALTILLVLLAVASIPLATAQFDDGGDFDDGGQFGDGTEFNDGSEDFEFEEEDNNADTVYVREDGSGVLVYNSSEEGTNASVSFGFSSEEGLFHLVADGTYEDERGFVGDLSVEAEPASWLVEGSFEANETEAVENVDVEVMSRTDETNSELEARGEARMPLVAFFDPRASTDGEVVVGPGSFESSGGMSYEIPSGFGDTERKREVARFSLSETEDGYLVEERRRTVLRDEPSLGNFSFTSGGAENFSDDFDDTEGFDDTGGFDTSDPVSDWGTRDDALRTLQEKYNLSSDTDGEVVVEIGSYSFENVTTPSEFGTTTNEYLLDIDYSVEYPGLKEEIADAFVENTSEDDELSQETANEISEAVRNLRINSLSYNLTYNGTSGGFNWNVDVENYNDALLAFTSLFSEIEPEDFEDNATGTEEVPPSYYEEIFNTTSGQWRDNIEATRESGLVSRWSWSGDLESGVASFDLTRETENWESYINELEERDAPVPPESSFDLTATSTESGLEGDLRWEVGGKGLRQGYNQTFDIYRTLFESSEEFNASVFDDLENSEFRVAKMDASVDEGEWGFETGAKFDNSTAVSSLVEEAAGFRVTEVVGTQEGGTVTTYVKADNLVDEPDEEAVRSLDQVDDETQVRLPGEWDRDFPKMDTASAKRYLGIEEGPSLLLILGVVALLVAVLAVAAVAYRRRREE